MEKGSVIVSMAGRDKEKMLVVLEHTGKIVLIADGDERPLKKPKSKNICHIKITDFKLEPCQYETDRMLKRALASLQKEECNLG